MNTPAFVRPPEYPWSERTIHGCRVRHAGPESDKFLTLMAACIEGRPIERGMVPRRPESMQPAARRQPRIFDRKGRHDETIRAMVARGNTQGEIAAATGMTGPGVARAAERLGLTPRRARQKRGANDERIRQLAIAGETQTAIAGETGLTLASVQQAIKRLGVHRLWQEARERRKAEAARAGKAGRQ